MIASVHQPQYIPWLGYFHKIATSDCFVFLDTVQYKPREYQNRNRIKTDKGAIWLTVPVVTKGKGRQRICDVTIDNDFPWRRQHLKSLQVSYAKAPYFNDYFEFFSDLYSKEWDSLSALNVRIIVFVLQQLGIKTPVYFESNLDIKTQSTQRIIDICKKLKMDTYLSGSGGKEYMDEAKVAEAGIKLVYQEFHHPVYRQQFMKNENDFLPFMSILDLLFNEGPHAHKILLEGKIA